MLTSAAMYATNNSDARASYGDALYCNGDLIEAEAELRAALPIDPSNDFALRKLGELIKALSALSC